ncbi:MAG: sugar phosphate isomerase/epimerase [Planctomycetota bacterium]
MRTGINLLLWTTFVEEQHYRLLSSLREMGYDGVELPLGRGDASHYAALAAELDRVGLARTAVVALTPDANPASPDPAVRAAAGAKLAEAIELTATLGADTLCGPFHSAFKHFTGHPPTDDELRWSADVLRGAAERAEAAGVVLAIEALNRFECYLVNTMSAARRLARLVDHPSLGVHYDTHHMHIEERDVTAAVEHVRDELRHVHISENDRGVPGAGQVNWADTFAALRSVGYDGWLTIESFSRADAQFAGDIHIWRDFARDADQVATEGLAFLRSSWAGSAV